MDFLANTPDAPYYAVIFSSTRTEGDNGYAQVADQMVALARQQPGFLGVESVRDPQGPGITVSYWDSLESIRNWKEVAAHKAAQLKGREVWYSEFAARVCKVERANVEA